MQDGGDTVQSATTVLDIVIVDVTDPPPSFSLSEYTFYVNEGLTNVSQDDFEVHILWPWHCMDRFV